MTAAKGCIMENSFVQEFRFDTETKPQGCKLQDRKTKSLKSRKFHDSQAKVRDQNVLG